MKVPTQKRRGKSWWAATPGPVVSLLVGGGAMLGLSAPWAAAEAKTSGHVLRILTVGNREPFRQEVRGGARYEVDPPEGSLPPAEVHTGFTDRGEQETSKSAARLRLGEISTPLRFPVPESGRIRIMDSGNQTWLEPTLSPKGATLVVAWKTGPKWNEVGSLSMDDSEAAVPEGTCRIVNASHLEIGVVLGTSRYRLPPGKSQLLSFEPGSALTTMEILYADPGSSASTLKAVLRTAVSSDPGIRRQWIVHRSDQTGARRPLGVIPVFEPRLPPIPLREDQAAQ